VQRTQRHFFSFSFHDVQRNHAALIDREQDISRAIEADPASPRSSPWTMPRARELLDDAIAYVAHRRDRIAESVFGLLENSSDASG